MRFRKDIGDLTDLKESIKKHGLIHPIVVDSNGELISGERRLKACEELGIEPVYRTVDFDDPKGAEVDENTVRKPFTPSEIYEISQYYNKKLSNQGERSDLCVNHTEVKHPRDVVSNVVGVGNQTLSRINTIFEKADEETKKKVDDGKVSVDKAYKQVKREEKKKEESVKGAQVEIDYSDIDFRLGDFVDVLSDVPDGSIDLILTDPPYPGEFIEQWSRLSEFASRKLKKNGFCIAYSGQLNLPEVMRRMSEHLDYYWTFCLTHSGTKQFITPRTLYCGWKPILVFQNGFKRIDNAFTDIIDGSGIEKTHHKWQQAEQELTPIINHFSSPGDIILEPFAGGGTTIIAAYKSKRRVIAAEIEEDSYNIAKGRINDSFKS